MDAHELWTKAADGFGRGVHDVGDRWSEPTPCEDWNVRELVNHVAGEQLWTPSLLEGRTVEEVGDRFEGDVLGGDPVAVWDQAAASATDAVRGTDREQTVHLSIGDVPAEEYLMQLFADFLIHSWDLDQGLGGGDPLDSDLVAACASWFADREELYRSAGAIGPRLELPDDADDQARLLAAFGRRS